MTQEDTLRTFPNRLWLYRKKRELTQKEVAALIGLSDATTISDYERGRSTPSLLRALALASALNTPVELLYADAFDEIRRNVTRRREGHDKRFPNLHTKLYPA